MSAGMMAKICSITRDGNLSENVSSEKAVESECTIPCPEFQQPSEFSGCPVHAYIPLLDRNHLTILGSMYLYLDGFFSLKALVPVFGVGLIVIGSIGQQRARR